MSRAAVSTSRIRQITLQRVHFIPRQLEPGILYVSEDFDAAAHLCACGCGAKVRTPLGPTEWSFSEAANRPTLFPSIGRWQLPCQSHYWIEAGEIIWDRQWSRKEIAEGRAAEDRRRRAYERQIAEPLKPPLWHQVWQFITSRFRRLPQ